ncbi:uracil-DNA glycosylase [Mogibacterium diversum]|uniref:uracil-DNA glycosylase n=1 Tax=Mogibacterium diversum TaxID=114527 RepID=UPI0028D7B2FE|nr:uracil-DNA glycosylase [Mogibacterium diversum]
MNNNLRKWLNYLDNKTITDISKYSMDIVLRRTNGEKIHPEQNEIFKSLELTDPHKIKVIVIGQDPYHGDNEAMGLAFSVKRGTKIPPSLRNIYEELESDLGEKPPLHGDLTSWAREGVLLINTYLTVSHKKPLSHANLGSDKIVKSIIKQLISDNKDILIVAWGAYAINFANDCISDVDGYDRANLICSTHPSPMSARRDSGYAKAFIGSRPFSRINNRLIELGKDPINWKIT